MEIILVQIRKHIVWVEGDTRMLCMLALLLINRISQACQGFCFVADFEADRTPDALGLFVDLTIWVVQLRLPPSTTQADA